MYSFLENGVNGLKMSSLKRDRIELNNAINYSKECKQPSQLGNKRE